MKINKIFRWIILCISIIGFILILDALFENEILALDRIIYDFISKYFITDLVTKMMLIITNLGGEIVLIGIIILLLLLCKNEKIGITIFINLITVAGINYIIKNIVERNRPIGFRIIEVGGYSFPSGHSMASMAFYGYIIYLIYKLVKNNYAKWTGISIMSTIIALIGFSRIYLGVHYTSDVLAGFLLSIAYLIVFVSITDKYVFGDKKELITLRDKRMIKVETKKVANSFKYAIQGFISSFKTERNMKIHITIMLLVIILCIIVHISLAEWIICIILFGLVIGAELFNTSIEAVVDIVMPYRNEKAKLAKDVSAAAVFVITISVAIVGGIIFLPKIILFLQ